LAERYPSTKFHHHRTLFLAVVAVVTFVSVFLFCGWQTFAHPLQASQSTAFGRVSASGQRGIPGSASMLAASENGEFDGQLLSDVSDDTDEDDRAFHPSTDLLGMVCFLVFLLLGRKPLLTYREEPAIPFYSLHRSILERPG
jgi:hypothetical protein